MNTPQTISPQEAMKCAQEALLLDVRTPAEFEESHIEGAVLHPLHTLSVAEIKELTKDSSQCIVVCRSGGRATQAFQKLTQEGFSKAVVLEGGMMAWQAAGLPTIEGRKTISLERQVRIAAGALVLIGVILGFTISPAWYALSGFIGAGLMFAGITDTCGMGMVLARMPWNARSKSCCSQ
jgi:rhodanese-related sulfurtransferase